MHSCLKSIVHVAFIGLTLIAGRSYGNDPVLAVYKSRGLATTYWSSVRLQNIVDAPKWDLSEQNVAISPLKAETEANQLVQSSGLGGELSGLRLNFMSLESFDLDYVPGYGKCDVRWWWVLHYGQYDEGSGKWADLDLPIIVLMNGKAMPPGVDKQQSNFDLYHIYDDAIISKDGATAYVGLGCVPRLGSMISQEVIRAMPDCDSLTGWPKCTGREAILAAKHMAESLRCVPTGLNVEWDEWRLRLYSIPGSQKRYWVVDLSGTIWSISSGLLCMPIAVMANGCVIRPEVIPENELPSDFGVGSDDELSTQQEHP